MKYLSLSILLMFLLSSCDSILSQNAEDFGHCDEELFEKIREKNSLRVRVSYDMEYTREGLLDEEQAIEQRERIASRHELLFSKLDSLGLEYSGASTLRLSPTAFMSVKEPGLEFLCTSELIKNVREELRLYAH
jgi:hypothetical protein